MPEERDLPIQGTAEPKPAPSFDEQVAGISDLLEDPATDLPDDDQDQAKAADEPAAEDDPLALGEPEDVATTDEPEDGDGPQQDYSGGRFAANDAKVRMDDGRVISVLELKSHADTRAKELQRGFTEKTTALSAKEREVDQRAQSLNEFSEYASWYAEQHLPKQPGEPPDVRTDPHGFLEWQQKDREWQTHVQAYQAFKAQKESESQRRTTETKAEHDKRVEAELEALKTALPVLKNPSKVKPFFDALMDGAAQHYGLDQQTMLNAIAANHRVAVIVRDALAYRKIKAQAPQVRDEVQKRPPVAGGKRGDPRAQVTREKQVRSERLRQDGSMDSAIAALMDLDL